MVLCMPALPDALHNLIDFLGEPSLAASVMLKVLPATLPASQRLLAFVCGADTVPERVRAELHDSGRDQQVLPEFSMNS